MSEFAKQVAEAILNAAQSGSAVWDELNGPSAELTGRYPENKFVITIPQGYDDDGPAGPFCRITVESELPS